MLKVKNRLTDRQLFSKVCKIGNFYAHENLALKYLENKSGELRFGFAIGKKVSKSAVTRNRLRRILRNIISENLNNIRPGFDIVIFYKKGDESLSKVSSADLEEKVKKLLKKGGFLEYKLKIKN